MPTAGRRKAAGVQEPLLARDVAALASVMRIPGRSKMTTDQKRAAIGQMRASSKPTTGPGRATRKVGGGMNLSWFDRSNQYQVVAPSKDLDDASTAFRLDQEELNTIRFARFDELKKSYMLSEHYGEMIDKEYNRYWSPESTKRLWKESKKTLNKLRQLNMSEDLSNFADIWFPIWTRLYNILFGTMYVKNIPYDFNVDYFQMPYKQEGIDFRLTIKEYNYTEELCNLLLKIASQAADDRYKKFEGLHSALYNFKGCADSNGNGGISKIIEKLDDNVLQYISKHDLDEYILKSLNRYRKHIEYYVADPVKQSNYTIPKECKINKDHAYFEQELENTENVIKRLQEFPLSSTIPSALAEPRNTSSEFTSIGGGTKKATSARRRPSAAPPSKPATAAKKPPVKKAPSARRRA